MHSQKHRHQSRDSISTQTELFMNGGLNIKSDPQYLRIMSYPFCQLCKDIRNLLIYGRNMWMQAIWTHGSIPHQLLWIIVVLIPKGGGDFRGIGLLEPCWKVLERIMDSRLGSIKLHDTLT